MRLSSQNPRDMKALIQRQEEELIHLREEVEFLKEGKKLVIWKYREAAARIEQLEAENASLAAWQCEFTDGKTGLVYGEGGGTYCAMAKRVQKLEAALREIADMIPYAMPDYSHQVWKTARAALEERT